MYADQAYMVDAYGESEMIRLTDRTGDVGAIVASVLNQALAAATATINGYLQSRYPLPLNAVPANLSQYCADIARYYLYDNTASAAVEKRYEDALAWLDKVATGKINIGPDEAGEPAAQSNNTASVESAGTVFGRQGSKGFI